MALPSDRRAKESGALERDLPSGVVQNSQNGWEEMPTVSGSKSSRMSLSCSSQDSYPTTRLARVDHHVRRTAAPPDQPGPKGRRRCAPTFLLEI
jgi:hypothetical protein